MENKSINRLHFLYITGILIAIIILLLTMKFGNNENLVAYLSFALTMTSLFLALIAIVYAYISNASFNKTISSLDRSSNDISTSSKNLELITQGLDEKFEKLPKILEILEKKVDWTNLYLFDRFEKNQSNINQGKFLAQNVPELLLDRFLAYSSTIGLFVLYAASLSFKNTKPFTLSSLCETVELLPIEYSMGYLTSVSSFGLFSRSDYSEKWTITEFNTDLSNKLVSAINQRIELTDDPQSKNFLKIQLDLIMKYFGEK